MGFVETVLLAIVVGCDAFAVGMGVGARFSGRRQIFRLSFHFGLFQFIMPIIGWSLSRRLPEAINAWAPWIAFTLLFVIGVKMVYESLPGKKADPTVRGGDPTRGWSLLVLSVAASLDALGFGFSMGILKQGLLIPAIWFGFTAGAMTWMSMKLGSRLSVKFGHWVEVAGGLILIAIALELVL